MEKIINIIQFFNCNKQTTYFGINLKLFYNIINIYNALNVTFFVLMTCNKLYLFSH